ncbi:MAG: hypothetical protein DCC75_07720, partial [Proteobacteria bacterium]
ASAFADSRKTLTGEIVSEKLESGAVTVTAAARDFKPLTLILPESEENSRCLETSADLKLDLSIGSPLDSKGTLSLSKLDLGCQPYKLSLQGAPQLSITGGRINFPGVTLQSANSRFSLDGYLAKQEDSALEITGSINLQTLLPLARRVDDLKGLINLSLVLSGPLGAPSIDGHATLSEAGFDIEQTDISASNLSGRIDFDGDKIEVPSLEGELNQGAVSITAQIYPFDLVSSNVEVSFEDGIFEPLPDVSMSVSSQLGYAISESGRPSLKGRVLINSAEFQKNIDFFAILRNLTRSVFTRKLAETEAVAVSDLPLIDLDLEIVAPGNLFIISNILALELKSDLRLTGTLREPVVQGKLETLSGWLGFRDRRFDITSGQLIFRPPNLDPYFDVLAETNVRSRQGDNVLIFLQMTGPLSNPIFALTSDRGLTERELIQLVTSATDLRGRAGTNVLGQSFKVEPLPFLRDRSLLGFGRLIRDFARIDRLGVEPTFNPQRGTIEPTVVAEKNITDRLDLVGESSLSGSEGESRAELIYTLSPKLSVAGILETITSRDTTAAGADLTYTILEQHTRFLEIEIEGNDYISSSELLDSIKLHENSRVKVPDLHQLESRLTTFIQEQGYFEGDAKVFCPVADGELCREISLIVSEGSPSYVTKVEFEGIIPDVSKAAEKLSDLPSKTPAKSSFKEQMLYHIIGAMRSEGYISARAEANYEPLDAGKVLLRIKTEPGDPVSFVFKGNTRFTPEEFLNTINFFERKQPFGRNTINILVDNIDRKYREAGYLYCTVSHEITSEPDSSRVIYVISIEEGPQVPVKEVIFEGNRSISDQRLDELIGDLTDSTKDDLLYPDFAVAEQLEQNQRVLVNLFVEEGFPDVQLSYRLEPSADEKEVVIKYIIEEGAAVKADSFRIRGLPDGFPSPEVPEAPYSIPKANRFIESLAGALEREGYFSAQVSTRIVLEESALEVLAVPGDVTLISDILVQGQSIVSKDTLLENITVKAGDPWSPAKLDDSKKKLLNLGLFARVEFEALDGAVDSLQEILVIRVIERSMQTLQVGTGVNSEFGLHLFGEASDRSYFADGRSITARLDTYYDRAEAEISQGIASLTFSDPTLFKSSYGFVSDLRFQRLDQDTYEFDLDRISLASYLHRNLNENLSSTLGYTIFTEDLTDVTPGAILGEFDEGDVRLGFISGTLIYDRRDSPLTPRSGYYLGLDYNIASEPLGSEANYGGFGGRASFIKPLPTRLREWAIAWQGRAASQWTFAGTDFVPISQRYYLGGRNSVRGFRENSLGPR